MVGRGEESLNHYYQCSKGHSSKNIKARDVFLPSAHPYRVLYTSVKFYENILNGFQLWSRHKKRDEKQTDR